MKTDGDNESSITGIKCRCMQFRISRERERDVPRFTSLLLSSDFSENSKSEVLLVTFLQLRVLVDQEDILF